MRHPRQELFRLFFTARFSSQALPSERIQKTLDRLYGAKLIVGNQGVAAEEMRQRAKKLGMQLVMVSPNVDRFQAEEWKRDFSAFYKASFQESEAGWLELENILRTIHAFSPQNALKLFDPGYGFISEHPLTPQVCKAAGITFIGPPSEALAACGNKGITKRIFRRAGIAPIPAYAVSGQAPEVLQKAADSLGYPIMVKKRRSGGGRGNAVAKDFAQLCDILEKFESEGEPTPLLEKLLVAPRHLEKQVIAGKDGFIVWPDGRDCSTQRHHAKIVEQGRSCIPVQLKDILHGHAIQLAHLLWEEYGYVNSSLTIEFLITKVQEIFGLENNPRLQVEHLPTALISGVDIITLRWMLTAGATLRDCLDYFLEKREEDWEKFPTLQDKADRLMETGPHAHAVEFRLNGVRIDRQGRQESVRGLIVRGPQSESDETGACNVGYKVGDYFSSHDATPLLATIIGTGPNLITAYANAYRRLVKAAFEYQVCFNVSSLEEFKAVQESPAFPLHLAPLPTNALNIARILCHRDFQLHSSPPLPDVLADFKKNKATSYGSFFPCPTTHTTVDVDQGIHIRDSKEVSRLEKELAAAEESSARVFQTRKEEAGYYQLQQEEQARWAAHRERSLQDKTMVSCDEERTYGYGR